MNEEQRKRIQDHLDHLQVFQDAAKRLSMKLIENGEIDLGRLLLANAQLHDQSKFFGCHCPWQ